MIAHFQIKFQVEHYTIARFIVDEGASVSILSTRGWRGMGFPSLILNDSQLRTFDRITRKNSRVLTQTHVSLGGETNLVHFKVIENHLGFNMVLRIDYVYAMKFVVYTLFHLMHFSHNEKYFHY